MSEVRAQAAQKQAAQRLVTELKVSGHLMSFDAGLFCIFNQPGSPLPDPGTGLPGVRVSLPPGPAFHPEAVTITTFRDDGWLGGWNGAALIRVLRGPAQVLVTIYQAPNASGDAPRLQVVRLSDAGSLPPVAVARAAQVAQGAAPGAAGPGGAAQAARPAPKPQAAAVSQTTQAGAGAIAPSVAAAAEVLVHAQGAGDQTGKIGAWIGQRGSKRWIEGFSLAPRGEIGAGDVEYQAVLGRGWLSPWAEGGQFCGSRGMSLPILGLRVRLRGEAADAYDCVVSASFIDGTTVIDLDNGEPAQAESLAPLEAFCVSFRPREEEAPRPVRAPAAKRVAKPVRAKR